MRALRAEGHSLRHLLECSGLRRSTYYYALAHPRRPTRPELRDAAAEIFSRTANGCGHRQIAMCLRAELGAVVADKTVLKMMREMGIRCGSRRRGSRRRYSSYRGLVGSTFENVIARDFGAEGPWWIGNTYLDDSGRDSPASLNSTGDMWPSVEWILKLLYQCT